jgi:outer membrane receptor protein involved in Fe transport
MILRKHSYLFFIVTSLFWPDGKLNAQPLSIAGHVMESSTREALPGATILLYSDNDTTVLNGTVSGDTGQFVITGIQPGNYWMEISYIGFISDTIWFEPILENKQLGGISLSPSGILMDGITIAEDQSRVIYEFDKKIYRVDQDLFAESGSASDVLQNIPSVSVDINGVLTMRGTQNVTIFINGKPSAMLRRNAAAVLAQIPANSIDRVEIITNPSARYRPDGVGGIINIVLKDEVQQKLSGELVANVGTERRWNSSLNLNYGKDALSLFANYGIRHSGGSFRFSDDRFYKNEEDGSLSSLYSESGSSRNSGLSHYIFAGAGLELNDFNSVEVSGSFFLDQALSTGSAAIEVADSLLNPAVEFVNEQSNDQHEQEGELNFAFEHVFKNNEDHTLSFEAAYSSFKETEDLVYYQQFTLPTIETQTRTNFIEKSGNQQEFLLDYVLPAGEDGELEAGYAGELIHENIGFILNQSPSRFLFDQQVHAGYATYGHAFDAFSVKGGVRAEQTMITSHLTLPFDSTIHNNYFKVFPSLFLGYELSDTRQFSLSYSKRINRPDSDELNPNPEYSDPRNAESGNASLKPEQVHSFEMEFHSTGKKTTFTSTLYYRHIFDAFTFVQTNVSDTVVLTTAANLSTERNAGLESILSTKLLKRIQFDLTGNIFYTQINAGNLGFTENLSTISGMLKGFWQYKSKKGPAVQCNAFYYFPTISPTGTRKAYFYFNAGLKQQLLKKKLAFTVTATDVFHTYKITQRIQSLSLDQTSVFQRRLPVVYVGAVWLFNGAKSKDELQFDGGAVR